MRDFGLLTALCLTVTAIGALVVVPAILRVLAKKNHQFLYLGVAKAMSPPSLTRLVRTGGFARQPGIPMLS